MVAFRWFFGKVFLRQIAAGLLIAATSPLCICHAQFDGGSVSAEEAHSKLNNVYRKVLVTLPTDKQQQLRIAERAWIAFSELDAAALRALDEPSALSEEQIQSRLIAEVNARTDDLREMAAGPPNQPREELRSRLEAADADLNKVYQECIERLSPGEIKVLRDAQRAWVKFRDENARANYKPSPTGEALAASLRVTLRRTEQLRSLSAVGDASIAPDNAATEKPVTETPDPFERAK
jgi:uncharacterized protein YecT (DUF1311 family)